MLTRREFLTSVGRTGVALALLPYAHAHETANAGLVVNDIHSQLNATRVKQVMSVDSLEMLRKALRSARASGTAVSIAGGRHSMGGQQFATDAVLLDMRGMNRIIELDTERGVVEVEAGIQWPELIDGLLARQEGSARPWGIVQKQTGADRLSLGGALGSNIHGRGLTYQPIVQNVEAFTLMDAAGDLHRCSRSDNAKLFKLVIGGYGLFGVVSSVELRLMPRTELASFLLAVREDFRKHGVQVIYGTIRLIEKDTESFLAWAKQAYACIVVNLHVEHTPPGIAKAHVDFQRLIDRAIERGGSYFLTYHRWARRDQVDACYPQMPEFLKLKRKYDPKELFQSDWYRHYKAMYADTFQDGRWVSRSTVSVKS